MSQQITVKEATYDLLRRLGLTTIFGNPGTTEEPFLEDFPEDFTYVLGLQEASVLAMADGYAQAIRHPALVNLHTSAGVGHAMGSLIGAFYNKTPLIVTAGQQTRKLALLEPYLYNVRAVEMPHPWVKWSYEPVRAEDTPAAFMRAYSTAVQPPAGPVFLSLPSDDFKKNAEGLPVLRTQSQRVGPDPHRLRDFALQISRAASPVLILGPSLDRSDCWEPAQQLAEKLKVPVWAPPETDKAVFPEDHPLFRGFLPIATAQLCEQLQGHDLVVVIGAPVFRYYMQTPGSYLPVGTRILHITDDPAEASRAFVGDSLLSDSRLAIEALLETVEPGVYPAVQPRTRQHPIAKSTGTVFEVVEVFSILQANRPDDAVILIESTSNLPDFHACVPITRPHSFALFASGGLGWALPAAVGYALAERESKRNRPVLAILGDGAANYSIQALWTAAQLKLPVIFLILRNNAYGTLKQFANLQQARDLPGMDLPGLDFVSLAVGYGCTALRVSTPDTLAQALTTAIQHDGPTVLEVPITAAVKPLL